MKSQINHYLKVFGIVLGIPSLLLCLMGGLLASKYESQTSGLYERVYPPLEADGYDLSHHNKNVKWDALSDAEFVYLKATEGVGYTDPKFRQFTKQAKKHGIRVGAYHFMTAKTSGKAQFNHFLKTVGDDMDLIPVLDVEKRGISNENIKQFISECEKHYGVKPMIYANTKYYYKHYNAFKGCKWWMAHYKPGLNALQSTYAIWQYSDKRKVAGMQIDHNHINNFKYTIDDFLL